MREVEKAMRDLLVRIEVEPKDIEYLLEKAMRTYAQLLIARKSHNMKVTHVHPTWRLPEGVDDASC